MTRPVSYDRLLRLAHQRAIDGKGGLAASIAKMCLDSRADLTAQELELTFDILRQLIDKVEIQIRRYISDYLAERTDVPEDLIMFLANDDATVAYPVLLHSQLLNDKQLISVIRTKSRKHAIAVAERAGISEDVTNVLIETGDVGVITQLIRNYSARISSQNLETLADASQSVADYRDPLLKRRDLPPELAARMYKWVGETLRSYILQNFEIAPELLQEATNHAVEMSHKGRIPAADRLYRAFTQEGKGGFLLAFAQESGLPHSVIDWVFNCGNLEVMSVAAKAYGLTFNRLRTVAESFLGEEMTNRFKEDGSFKKANEHYDRIDQVGAMNLLKHWANTHSSSRH